ncbi:MAG: heparinase II/III family protein [Planctomycetia bacterium]|nr:heparinase II/III family protein [Planctomycetia bacterium]
MLQKILVGMVLLTVPAFGENLLDGLKQEHPRILFDATHQAERMKLLETDPFLQELYGRVKKDAETLLEQDDTVKYEIVGPRLLAQSRLCLRRILTLATMYRTTREVAYKERAMRELRAAAAFPNWNPSHFLDTAEMTAAFAIGYDWMYDALSQEEKTLLETAIYEKGLLPGLAVYRRGTWWTTSEFNWNQVCNGGMTMGILAIADTLEGEKRENATFMLEKAIASIPRAMASFAPDGAWAEGPGYWSYTLKYTIFMIQSLECAIGQDFGISQSEGFAHCGDAQLAVAGATGYSFNFADAGSGVISDSAFFWLADRFQNPMYAEYLRGHLAGKDASCAFWYYTPLRMNLDDAKKDFYFRGVEIATMRTSWNDPNGWYVGFKAGDNDVNHSHLELGMFVLEKDGVRWAVDLGADNYNLPKYFGTLRWTYYRLSTRGQNTLLVDNENQNPKAVAPITDFESTQTKCRVVADLTAAYAGQLDFARRTITLDRERSEVEIFDEMGPSQAKEILWQIHTFATITLSDDKKTATLKQGKKQRTVEILEPANGQFEVRPTTPSEAENPNTGVSRLVIPLSGTNTPQTFRVRFR